MRTHGSLQREMLRLNGLPVGHNRGALECVLQLTDVAWPTVPGQFLERCLGQPNLVTHRSTERCQERLRQQRDVLRALSKRRYWNIEDLEAIVQVFAKRS